MSQIRMGSYQMLPPIIKNLIIINVLFFLATMAVGPSLNINLNDYLALHYFQSQNFMPHQLVTYMFMHGGFSHILFNMFALWMFGSTLENFWGPKRFLIYYTITGIGAGIIQMIFMHIQFMDFASNMDPAAINQVLTEGGDLIKQGLNWTDTNMGGLNSVVNTTVVGASGSIYGVLLAFGMIFPESLIYVYFMFPIKAKWFVIIFGALELFSGIRNSATDNVAHFAHLGGMLFGFILIKIWQNRNKSRKSFEHFR